MADIISKYSFGGSKCAQMHIYNNIKARNIDNILCNTNIVIFQHVGGRCGCRDGRACSTETPTYFANREQTRQDGSFQELEFGLRSPSAALTNFSLLSRSAMTYFHSSPCASTSLLFNSRLPLSIPSLPGLPARSLISSIHSSFQHPRPRRLPSARLKSLLVKPAV